MNNLFKKTLAIIMVVVLCFSLAACGGDKGGDNSGNSQSGNSNPASTPSDTGNSGDNGDNSGTVDTGSGPSNQKIEIEAKNLKGRVFTFAAPSWDNTVETDLDWVKALEKKYNCKFKNLNLNNDYTTLYSSILAGNPIADVVVFNNSNFYPAVKKGLLKEMKSSKNINYQDSGCFIPKAQEKLTTVNGKLYGAIDTYAFRHLLVYNRSIIKGNDDLLTLYNNGQLTWDKLYEILQKVVKAGKYGISGKQNEEGIMQIFILANGSTFYKRDGINFTYNLENQNTRDAIEYVRKLKAGGLTMPLDGGNYLYPQQQFVKGRVAMMIADGWNLDYFAKNAKFDYGVVMIPSKNNPKSGLVDLTEFECYSIPSSVKNPDDVELIFAAWKQAEEASNNGKKYSLTKKSDALDTKDAAIIKKYAEAIEKGQGIVDYRNALTDYYADDLYNAERNCLYGASSVQEYLESVAQIYKAKANSFNKG